LRYVPRLCDLHGITPGLSARPSGVWRFGGYMMDGWMDGKEHGYAFVRQICEYMWELSSGMCQYEASETVSTVVNFLGDLVKHYNIRHRNARDVEKLLKRLIPWN
jgi:hypothetical protein